MSIYENARINIVPRNTKIKAQATVSFGLDAPEDDHYGIINDEKGEWLARGDKKLLNVAQLGLMGDSGKLNALAALALSERYIKDWNKAIRAIRDFNGLPHRCQHVFECDGVQWVDDSKGTNIGATIAAIKGLNQPIVLLLGGIHKGGDLDELVSVVSDKVTSVISFGRDRDIFYRALAGTVKSNTADTLEDAVLMAAEQAQKNDVVLFSPACASFDMFANYQERGNAFQRLAKKYGAAHGK
jgi:UDP-N-acetylmuramoylalanine--D-glutamate ligase